MSDEVPSDAHDRRPPPPPPLLPPSSPPPTPPPTPPQPYASPWPPPPRESRAIAVIALIFSVLPLVLISQIVGLILGIVHLATHRRARGMAIAAIVLSIVMAFVYLAALGAIIEANKSNRPSAQASTPPSTPRPSASPTPSGRVIWYRDLTVGECGMQPANLHDIVYLTIVPCSQRHQFEVYAVFLLPAGPFPGLAKVHRLADVGCARRFAAYVGTAQARSSLAYTYLSPLPGAWDFDQHVRCLILTGPSQRGSVRDSNA